MPIPSPGRLAQRGEFYRQMGQLTAAGIGLPKSIEMLAHNPPSRSYRAPLLEMLRLLGQGASFTDAIRALGGWTPAFDVALIQAGEHSGRLDAVFRLLGDFYADRALLMRQMIADLAYPMFVFHMAIFLFPFIAFFSNSDWVAFLLRTFGVLIPLYLVVGVMVYLSEGKRGAGWRAFLERVLKPVPVLGTARQYMALSRLSAALEALLNAGVTVIEAWELAAAASGSPMLQRTVQEWKPRVVAGQTPSEAVRASQKFPELFENLYYSGEVSGQLDETLKRLHNYYHQEGTRRLRMLAQWVPRFIYLGIALFVAFKVIEFYSGYFKQINQIMGQ